MWMFSKKTYITEYEFAWDWFLTIDIQHHKSPANSIQLISCLYNLIEMCIYVH